MTECTRHRDAVDSEVLTNVQDKSRSGLPREGFRRKHGMPPSPPALWAARPTVDFSEDPEPVWGAYPKRFISWACSLMQVDPRDVLHVCSGGLPSGHGIRVDLRTAAKPDVRADGCRLPFRDSSFAAVLIDPPYTVEYSRDLYGLKYPRPSHLLEQAARVVKPCGFVGILHFLVPMSKPPLDLVSVHGITTGAGYRIRAFTIYRRAQDSLFDAAERDAETLGG